METNRIVITNKGTGMEDALNEVESFAGKQDLDHKQTLRLRLLAEEMMGMVTGIVGDFKALFWLEGKDRNISLHIEAQTVVDMSVRDELLSVSTTGKNIAAKGITGKLRDLFETYMLAYEEVDRYAAGNGMNLFPYDEFDMMHAGMDISSHYWSLRQYKNDVGERAPEDESAAQAWDELEKSIVGSLADDVLVGIRSDNVEMIVRKDFNA